MEKEQILSTLNEKLEAEGIKTESFQRTFGDYVDNNLPAEGAEFDFDRHVKILKSISGQFSHDLAEAIKGQQSKNGQQSTSQQGSDSDKRYDELAEKFDKLMDSHEKLVERLNQKESQQTQEQLMAKVKAEMKKQGADDEYVLKQTLRGLTLDAKKSVADLAKELMTAYDSEYTACRGKGAAPRNGGQQTGGKGQTYADRYFADKQRKEGWGKQPDKNNK